MTHDEARDERDEGWEYSSEGELDPDLTEEAGYAGWEPPERNWAPVAARVLGALALAAFALGILSVLFR